MMFMFSVKIIEVVISLGCHGNLLNVTPGQFSFLVTEMLFLSDPLRF